MRGIALLLCFVSATAAAQQPVPPAPLAAPESARAESIPPYLNPTPAQARYMAGLKTAGRGIAQLKEAVSRVDMAGHDSTRLHQAGLRLAGWCGTARQFMTSGRAKMTATAYSDSTQLKAKHLAAQIDTLIRLAPQCESTAVSQTASTVDLLVAGLRSYEAVLRDFRAAIGLPNR